MTAVLSWVTPTMARAQPVPAQFRGGPGHSGVVETAGVERLGGLAWRFRTGGPVRSSPTVAEGVVYFGSGDGVFYALDADTGARLWTHEVGAPVGGAALVTTDRVVFTDRANRIHALSRPGGEPLWRVDTGADLPLEWGWEGWDYLLPSPTLVDGTVLAGSGDGHLYALDLADGRVLWRFATGGRIRSAPAVRDGVAYVGSGDGVVYGVSVDDGREVWRFETAGIRLDARDFGFDRTQIQSSPALADGTLYVGSRDASLYAVDLESREARWTFEEGSAWVVMSPAVRGNTVFSGRSSAGTVRALDARTGAERWVVRTRGPVFSSPVVVGNTVYVASEGGRLYAVDASDGTVRWTYPLGRGSVSTPAVWEGRVYVGSDDGHLYALRDAEGPPPRLAVYWDDAMTERARWGREDEHRRATTYFEAHGYEVLDTAALRDFLEARIDDGTPSVVVFGMDALPASVADPDAPAESLLRRYLERGGKAVWLGAIPPLTLVPGAERADRVDRGRTTALLGVDVSGWNGDLYGVSVTPAGHRWGLETPWVGEPWLAPSAFPAPAVPTPAPGSSRSSVPPDGPRWLFGGDDGPVVALAVDELGNASAWAKSYGGPPGTGFVVVGRTLDPRRYEEVRRVAEYGVFRAPVEGSR